MFRNRMDYYKYVFKYKSIEIIFLFIDLSLFIVSTYTVIIDWNRLLKSPILNFNYILLIVFSFIKFFYDLYKMYLEVKANFELKHGELISGNLDNNEIAINPKDIKKYGYEIVSCNTKNNQKENVFNSPLIDDHLMNNELTITISKVMSKRVSHFIKENAETLFQFLRWQYRSSNHNGRMFYNESKLCLSKDIDIKRGIATCHKGSYFDTFLTNIISGKQIRSNMDDSLIASAMDFFPIRQEGNNTYLKDISSSELNNEIGISTLAITSDQYLVVWTQNKTAQSSNGLLVPTGSGSCDWKDYKSTNFKEIITYAMNRELWEESGGKQLSKNSKEVGSTIVIGFFRWISKAGKPEFVGLTKVNQDLLAFTENKSEVYGRQEFLVENVSDLLNVIERLMDSTTISIPLYMNLYCLQKQIKKSPEFIANFMGIEHN